MNHAHQTRMMVGVGTAMGAVILGSFLAGCAPGTICDKEGYEAQCAGTGRRDRGRRGWLDRRLGPAALVAPAVRPGAPAAARAAWEVALP